MKVVEFFAGTCSFSGLAEREFGAETFTTDSGLDLMTLDQYAKIDLVSDIFDLQPKDFPFQPDIVWASPPCTYFSVASIGKHWNKDHTPKSNEAVLGLQIVEKTLEFINILQPKYWFMENPRGKLRKLPITESLPIHTVTYCQYGENRMKPTDIWTNAPWTPRPMCKNGDSCHESAPRGSQTGTQGIKYKFDKSRIPEELCRELLEVVSTRI